MMQASMTAGQMVSYPHVTTAAKKQDHIDAGLSSSFGQLVKWFPKKQPDFTKFFSYGVLLKDRLAAVRKAWCFMRLEHHSSRFWEHSAHSLHLCVVMAILGT